MTSTALLRTAYSVRQGDVGDTNEVERLVRARANYMRLCGQGGWASWTSMATDLGKQVADPAWPTWVLVKDGGQIVGITTATFTTPSLGWAEHEQAESAVFLQSTVTHPDFAGEGLGILLAFWALDYAAEHGRQWVRRGVLTIGQDNHGLLGYYRFQGWRVTRSVPHARKHGVTVWSLQRPAEAQPDLVDMLRASR
jgi:GNAT superfamily N-acetyltransferase